MKWMEFFISHYWNAVFMGEKCQNCNKKIDNPELTYCSDECLFDQIPEANPIGKKVSSMDDWDSNSWI